MLRKTPDWQWEKATKFYEPNFVFLLRDTLLYDLSERTLTGRISARGGPYLKPQFETELFNAAESAMAAQQMMGLLIGALLFQADRGMAPSQFNPAYANYPANIVVARFESKYRAPLAGRAGESHPTEFRIVRYGLARQQTAGYFVINGEIGTKGEHVHYGMLALNAQEDHGLDLSS